MVNKSSTNETVYQLQGMQLLPAGSQSSENEKTRFIGSHFEGLGDAWNAVLGEFSDEVEEGEEVSLREMVFNYLCVECVEKGIIEPSCKVFHQAENKQVVLIQSDPVESVQIGALVVSTDGNDNNEMLSCYPVLQGLPNAMQIAETHTWTNGVEGEVLAYPAGGGIPISFFAPFYFKEFMTFEPNKHCEIFLAALVLSIKQSTMKSFTVNEGEFYEAGRARFLIENPGKTEVDFVAPEIIMEGARLLIQRDTVSYHEFRLPVLGVEQCYLADIPIVKIKTEFFVDIVNDALVQGYLYATAHKLDGYIPQIGDDIEGVLWMTGYLGQEQR